ncbi:ABC transporter ATP-binding protein [Enterovirga rhinocerotis]|uniref:Amino acid/amide ABC transporter ATP-binding protein 2 (HAAT family) n=1 Tax=Enterovirga rhinocerotis TaxID=1339210 RepID=A0A4V6PZP2_9HYPH|nr:ABC transporter ATP-binding protein [Enterovirga rhinocerotis]TDR95059.1 amino acid/amide ABC transporter ATP-binding protein 2 (HAAT family) [Enterovirga rhinocerotis]
MESKSPAALALTGIEAGYVAGVPVLSGVDLEVREGEVVTLLGRNGAGKSTAIRVICGLLKPNAGRVELHGERIDGLEPAAIVGRGIAVVPEGRRVFGSLSVEENLLMGGFAHRRGIAPKLDLDAIYTSFPRLVERRTQLAGTLSGGEQQMVAMGRALMAKPRVLLLDEPSMGLAPMLIDAVFDMISTLAGKGLTILLVEQNASEALDVADRAYVLERGRIRREGPAERLLSDPEIRASYLGVG